MVTRSSLVWIMTGIAAGIAGGWLWNRERTVDDTPSTESASSVEPIRSPFTQRREERATYLSPSDAGSSSNEPERAGSKTSSEFSQRQSVYESASHANREQLAALISNARALANPVERRNTLEVLVLRYAELDVAGALGEALDNDRETAAHLLASLTSVAAEQTWERAKEVTNPAERFAYLDAVVNAWAVRDPERAFGKVADLPAQWQRSELLQSVVAAIADRDPRLAIRLAESQGPVASGALTELIATQWARQNPSEAARWVEGLSRTDQARYAYRVADAYVAQKPSEALAWALRLAGSPQRYLWSSMLGEMAKYDPDQALQIAQSAESPAQRAQAMGKVLAAMAETNPSLAMTHLMKLPSGRMRSEILGEVARSVATLAPTAALDWLNDIDDDALQLEAAQSLGWALSRRNVEAAAQLVDRIPKEARANWINAVALGYAEFDIERGRQWVRRYANEGVDTATQFARMVASRNPEAAIQLVADVTDDQERDRLLAPALCDYLMGLAAPFLERAEVNDVGEGSRVHQMRSNSNARFGLTNTDVIGVLAARQVAVFAGEPFENQEDTMILRYRPGEAYEDHFDFVDPRVPAFAHELATRGQRIATVLVYLNDGYTGGYTEFPRLQWRYRGAPGDALAFRSVLANGEPDVRTLHAGRPPQAGEKWILSKWLRDRPQLGRTFR